MKVSQLGEIKLIQRLAELVKTKNKSVIAGIGDDSAVIDLGKKDSYFLFTTDTLVENIHFSISYISPFQLGWKAIAINISDICAMGGLPLYALITLGIPKDTKLNWVEELYYGMTKIAEKFNVSIVGGDMVETKPDGKFITVSLAGEVEKECLCLRSHAQVGDLVLASGNFGASCAGLEILKVGAQTDSALYDFFKPLINKHLMPEPQFSVARAIAKSIGSLKKEGLKSALTDSSDGLATDLYNISQASKVAIELEIGKIPIDELTKKAATLLEKDPVDLALYGGEDYNLVFTLPKDYVESGLLENIKKQTQEEISVIGKVVEPENEEPAVFLIYPSGKIEKLIHLGYDHFLTK